MGDLELFYFQQSTQDFFPCMMLGWKNYANDNEGAKVVPVSNDNFSSTGRWLA